MATLMETGERVKERLAVQLGQTGDPLLRAFYAGVGNVSIHCLYHLYIHGHKGATANPS